MNEIFQQGDFELLDNNLFEKLTEKKIEIKNESVNCCPECSIIMTLSGIEYQCPECGFVRTYHPDSCIDHDDVVSNSIRIGTGMNKGRFYNITADYAKTQMKFILNQLIQNSNNYKGKAFPMNVLRAAAEKYNTIQKIITESTFDTDGNEIGKKKFVRRGNIKDEVLAGLIYFEGIRENLVRKKKDISEFMKLPNAGFSRGEDILRNIEAEGKIDLPVDEEPMAGFIDRYLESLDLPEDLYKDFIIEIVEESEKRKLAMSSQISSKIVGVIWFIIVKCKLPITTQELEVATDNTKTNTFIKFYKILNARINIFEPIMKKYEGIKFVK
jgi:hypothetical protein